MADAEDSEYLKLPTIQKVQHKLWKARVCGYEEAAKAFHQAADPKDPLFQQYLPLMKKFVTDANAVALEKALPAVLAFVDNAGCAGKCLSEIISGLVAKCLGAPKAKTRELALEIILMGVEIEKQTIVQEELLKGLENKNPKIVSGTTFVIYECIRLFGPKVFPLKSFLKCLPKLLEDRDKGVRDEGKRLAVEMYRWFREAIKAQIVAGLKPVQIGELEAAFEQATSDGAQAVPERYIRSEQERMAEAGASGDGNEEGDEGEDATDGNAGSAMGGSMDPFDLLDPVDILAKLPKDFYTQIESKKWQERKEVLDKLYEALQAAPKLEPQGDYAELVKVLKKLVGKDTNVVIVAEATQCVNLLAQGLRNRFSPYAPSMLSTLLEKLKEKKPNVLTALRDALDSTMKATNLDNVFEDIVQSLGNKNPNIKAETASFVARLFSRSQPASLQKKTTMKPIVTQLLTTLNDSDPTVRDNSAEALGTLLKVLGERQMGPYLADVDQLKMAKIKESCEKAVVVATVPAPKSAGSAAPRPVVRPGGGAPAANKAAPSAKSAAAAKPAAGSTATFSRPATASKAGGSARPATAKGGGAANANSSAGAPAVFHEQQLSDEDVIAQLASVGITDEITNGLSSANWKERLAAAEQFKQLADAMEDESIPVQAIIRALVKKPGLKEANANVLKGKLEIVVSVLERGKISLHTADACLNDLVEKTGDLKSGPLAQKALSALAEGISLQHIAHEALNLAFQQRNPKVQSETLNWVAVAVKEFGLKMQLKPVIENMKAALSASNPGVRTAAVSCFGTLYMYAGAQLRSFFDAEKPAVLALLDAEIDKVSGESPPAPTRGLKPESNTSSLSGASNSGSTKSSSAAAPVAPPVMEDLFPRQNIGEQFTGSIITELADKNWKVRAEALDKVQQIISQAKMITPDIGDLGLPLKQRIEDTNKNLAVKALTICQQLIEAMGPNGARHLRQWAPSMLLLAGDSKANVRAAALECINTWVKHCGVGAFLEGDMLLDALTKENPFARIELFQWLGEQLSAEDIRVSIEDLSNINQPLFQCLEDRNANVRKNALDCCTPMMKILGYSRMAQRTLKLKASSRTAVTKHLDAIRDTLPPPVAPPSKKPGSAPSGVKGGAKKPVPSGSAAGKIQTKQQQAGSMPTSPDVEGDDAPAPPSSGLRKSGSRSQLTKVGTTAAARKAKEEEEAASQTAFSQNNFKTERIQQEKAMRVLKWTFQTPREEHITQLKDQMQAAGMTPTFIQYCFHSDFKFHLKAIDMMQQRLDDDFKAVQDNSDLLFKWITLRFFETNPSVVLKALEFLNKYFDQLRERDAPRITIEEHNALVPYLLAKLGDNKDPVRKAVKDIVKQLCCCTPPIRLFQACMAQLANKTKNARLNAEILEELARLMNEYSLTVCHPDPKTAIVQISKHISDRDNNVRSNALDAVAYAYFLDESLKKYVDEQLNAKDQSYLEERIKRLSKNRPQTAPANNNNARATPLRVPNNNNAGFNTDTIVRPNHGTITRPRTAGARATVLGGTPLRGGPVPSAQEDISPEEQQAPPRQVIQNNRPNILQKLNLEGQAQTLQKFKDVLAYKQQLPPQVARAMGHTGLPPDADSLETALRRSSFQDVMDALIDCQQLAMDLTSGRAALSDDEPLRRLTKSMVDVFDDTLHRHQLDQTPQAVSQCLDRLTRTLSQFAHCSLWTQCMNVDACQHMLRVVLQTVTDEALKSGHIPQSDDIVKSLNRLTVDVITRCDRLVVLTALIKLMLPCFSQNQPDARTTELILKCIWKSLRKLSDNNNGGEEYRIFDHVSMRALIVEIDKFLLKYPSAFWKTRTTGTDMPYKTIKTVLHTLLKAFGPQVISVAQASNCKSNLVGFFEQLHSRMINEGYNNENSANGVANPTAHTPVFKDEIDDALLERYNVLLEKYKNAVNNYESRRDLELFLLANGDDFRDTSKGGEISQLMHELNLRGVEGAFPDIKEMIVGSSERRLDYMKLKYKQQISYSGPTKEVMDNLRKIEVNHGMNRDYEAVIKSATERITKLQEMYKTSS